MLLLLVGLVLGLAFGLTVRFSSRAYDPPHDRVQIGSSTAIRVLDNWWVNTSGRAGWASCDSLQAALDYALGEQSGPIFVGVPGEPLPAWLFSRS